MVLQKHKISQNILQDIRQRPTKKKLNLVLKRLTGQNMSSDVTGLLCSLAVTYTLL
jgi:hypothetical protein